MTITNREVFDNTVKNRGLIEMWEDTLFETTLEEKKAISSKKYKEALDAFEEMMRSPKAKDSVGYVTWAIGKALNIRTVVRGKYK